MKISVLGSGRWGSFLAWYASVKKGYSVVNWGQNDAIFKNLVKKRKNKFVEYPENIVLTSDLKVAITNADIIIISISAQNLRSFICEHLSKFDLSSKRIMLCMKGIEEKTGKRLTEVAVECGIKKEKLAVWVGPGHIQDFVKGVPNCMVIDSYSKELTKFIADSFSSNLIRFYYGADIIGTEIGAATKNIFGLLAGMLDGVGFEALKGALMARGTVEIARLIKAMGGNEFSAYGLCHLGDYEATLFSKHSNNRLWGEKFIKNEVSTKLAEGVATAKAVKLLAEKYSVDMPITSAVEKIIQKVEKNESPMEILRELFDRVTKSEFV